MLWTSLRACAVLLSTLVPMATAPLAVAQVPGPAPSTTVPGAPAKQPPAPQKRAPAKPGEPASGATAAGGDGSLRQRVEQLEEQLVDMQVVIGTFESLAKGGGAAPPAAAPRGTGGGFGAGEAARIDSLETQIRALTSQLEQLAEQVRALGGPQRKAEVAPGRPNEIGEGFSARGEPAPGATAAIGAPPRFGSTTVTTDAGDPIGSLLSESAGPGANGVGSGAGAAPAVVPGQSVATAPLPPIGGADGSAANPKQLYETAYAHLLQQDYAAAEAAFDDFLKRFPGDSLAGNAQYWLGESYFVRGQYKPAASAFLKGYQTYGKSAKAPESLLKLAMSLDRLGQKEAACASFAELGTRFPGASANVKTRAQAERTRLGCT
jgi:tol-pal system protein YbgF